MVDGELRGRPLKRWSFSRLSTGERCMYKLLLQQQKAPKIESEASNRGSDIHKQIEDYILDKVPANEAWGIQVLNAINTARDWYARTEIEENWYFTKNWVPYTPSIPWHSDIWLQVKCDAALFSANETACLIYDWKSGKRMYNEVKHAEQAQLYAIAALKRYPKLNKVVTRFVYVDHNLVVDTGTFYRGDEDVLTKAWEERATEVITATYFPPKPKKSNCTYCDYGHENGSGACHYAYDG